MLALLASLAFASPRSFTRDFGGALEAAFPECRAAPSGKLVLSVLCGPEKDFTLSLARLYLRCTSEPSACGGERDTFLRSFADALHPGPLTLERVIPGVRSRARLALLGDAANHLVVEPLTGDLVRVYLVDSPSAMRYLEEGDLETLGLAREALLDATRPHIKAAAGELEVHEHDGITTLSGSVYVSSMMLDPVLWDGFAARGVVHVAVPARDILMFTVGDDAGQADRLRAMAGALLADPTLIGPIGAEVYRWDAGSWTALP